MYLKESASDWWLTLILEAKKPKDWDAFKQMFYAQFLPTNFWQDVKKEWDPLAQREHESIQHYVARFWSVLLKVTPFKKIDDEEKMQKFEAGLQSTKSYEVVFSPQPARDDGIRQHSSCIPWTPKW